MSDNITVRYVGPSFLTMLGLIFITLKLCGVIDWSWFWVLSPLWIPPALLLSAACVAAVVLFGSLLLDYTMQRIGKRK